MPVKNKIHNTQKAEGFPFEARPGSWTERRTSGAYYYGKKGQTFKKTRRQTTVRFILVRHIGRPRA